MLKKLFLLGAVITLAGLCWSGCDQNDGWSSNWSGDVSGISASGSYFVVSTPDSSITWLNLTQTENVVQAVDNRGVRYEGYASNLRQVSADGYQETITLQGQRPDGGSTITLQLQSQGIFIMDPMYSNAAPEARYDVTVTPADSRGQPIYEDPELRRTMTTNVNTAASILMLSGTYTDAAGLNGYIEFRKHSYDASDPTAVVNS